MALGVSFSKVSSLGVSPVNSIPCVVNNITKINTGLCTIVVFIGFIIIQMITHKRNFKAISLLQIFCSFLFGFYVSFTNLIYDKLFENIFTEPLRDFIYGKGSVVEK